MAEVLCTVLDGWSGIERALRNARLGDIVKLEPGEYEGDTTLTLPSGITLDGQNAVLKYSGKQTVLDAKDIAKITVCNIRIELGSTLEHTGEQSCPEGACWDVISIEGAESCTLTCVSVVSNPSPYFQNNFRASRCGSIDIQGCFSSFSNRHGFAIDDCRRGTVSACEAERSRSSGIGVMSSGDHAKHCLIKVAGNRCHDNGQAGIVLFSSKGELSSNECWKNAKFGVALQHDPDSPDMPTEARLEDNRCHHNEESGIVLFSSKGELISNECWENKGDGIALQRDPVSPDMPTEARLEDNRCHHNDEVGIVLFSSKGELISNECWMNTHSGIVLQRDPTSSDMPTEARLEDNRCHDNGQAGIVLFSSKGELISNECWMNTHSGIALQHDPDSPDMPTEARLEDNRCHHNEESGIVLFSSKGELSSNECWKNAKFGIMLQHDPDSPDMPTEARLEDNRCHHNEESGIVLFSSKGELISNECWENKGDGIALQHDPVSPDMPSEGRLENNRCYDNAGAGIFLALSRDLNNLALPSIANCICRNQLSSGWWENTQGYEHRFVASWDGITSDESEPLQNTSARLENYRQKRLQAVKHGLITVEIEEIKKSSAEPLALYLHSYGCEGCLAAAWDSSDNNGICQHEPSMLHRFHGQVNDADATILFASEGRSGLEDTFWTTLSDLKSDSCSSRKACVGVVSFDQRDIDRFKTQIAEAQEILQEPEWVPPALAKLSGPIRKALDRLKTRRQKLGPLLVVDHTERSRAELSGDQRRTPFLETELMNGRSRWKEALSLLVTTPLFWWRLLVFATILVSIFVVLAHLRGFEGKWLNILGALHYSIRDTLASQSAGDWFTGLLSIGSLITVPILIVNTHLPKALQYRPSFLKQFRTENEQVGKDKHIISDVGSTAWRRWVRRRLFRHDFNVLLVQNASEWSEEDSDGLRAVIDTCPPQRTLITIIHTQSATKTGRGILQGFAGTEATDKASDLGRLDGMRLIVNDVDDEIDAQCSEESLEIRNNLLGLLENDDAGQHEAGIIGGRFSIADIIPMMVLGSNANFTFTLSRPADPTRARFAPVLWDQLEPLARFCGGEEPHKLSEGELQQLDRRIRISRAVRDWRMDGLTKDPSITYVAMPERRQEIAQALRPLFGSDQAAFVEFLSVRVACGAFQSLSQASNILSADEVGAGQLANAHDLVAGFARLKVEAVALAPLNDFRTQMMMKVAADFRSRLQAIRAHSTSQAVLEASRLYAIARRSGLIEADPATLADLTSQTDQPLTPQTCFGIRLCETLELLRELDPEVAADVCRIQLSPERKSLGEEDLEALDEVIRLHSRHLPSFAKRLAACENADDFTDLLHAHRLAGKRLSATLYRELVLAATNDDERLKIAKLLIRHKEAGVAVSKHHKALTYDPGILADLDQLIGWMNDPETIELLAEITAHGLSADEMVLPNVMLSSFEPLQSPVQRKIEIRFANLSN